MPRKIAQSSIDHAGQLIAAGSSLKDAAAAIGMHPDNLSKRLRAEGHVIPRGKTGGHNRLTLPDADFVALYEGGASELAIAKQFGVSRLTVRRRLVGAGVDVRDGSRANFVRLGKLSSEERKALVAKARQTRFANLQTDAKSNTFNQSVGYGEREIAEALARLGHEVERQRAVDGYYVDIAIGNVAVEIKTKTDGGFGTGGKRTKQLIKSGMRVVFVYLTADQCVVDRLDEIVALTDFACRNPPSGGEYWVVRCRRERAVSGRYVYNLTLERYTPKVAQAAA